METTFLSACIPAALTSFLWPLREKCGVFLDGCVSQTLFCLIRAGSKLRYHCIQSRHSSLNQNITCMRFVGINPSLWDKADVAHWLHWAQKEYSLRRPERGRFEMNGRALCLLTKEDFRHRCPNSGEWVCMHKESIMTSFVSLCSCSRFHLQAMFCMRFYSV